MFKKEKGIFEFSGEWGEEVEGFKARAKRVIRLRTKRSIKNVENLDALIKECKDAGFKIVITYIIRGHQNRSRVEASSFAHFVKCALRDSGIEIVGRFDDPAPALHYLREEIAREIENSNEDNKAEEIADRVASLFDGFDMDELVLKLRHTNSDRKFLTPYNAEDMLKIAGVKYFSINIFWQ